ncbi:pentatricopeptide repeat-containing protein [Tanacetum coccineum]
MYLDKMVTNDIWPDKYTYTFVLKACTLLLDIEKCVWIHGQILKRGLECDVFIATGLVDLYCKYGRLVDARKVFDKMLDKDVAVWNAMVAGTKMLDKLKFKEDDDDMLLFMYHQELLDL